MSSSVRWLAYLGLASLVYSQNAEVDPELLNSVFGTPLEDINVTPTTAPTTVTEEDGSSCVCVPYFLCDPSTNATYTDGKFDGFGKLDIRFKPERCQVSVEVCCKAPRDPSNPIQPPPHPERISGCGIRNELGIDFQIETPPAGNNTAEFGEFPWTIAILNVADSGPICAGSLIHPQVVLTGAHCIKKLRALEVKVRAGEWDTQTTGERLPFQERAADRLLAHPNYNAQTLANDVGLIFLKAPFTEAENINTICLPPADMNFDTAKNCIGTGWGKTNFGKTGVYAVIMKKIELDMVNHAACQAKFQKTRLGPKFKLHSTFVCAGGQKGKDTCKGDGGGPLVCPSTVGGRYLQAGIVAWGIGCGEQDVPAAYGHVSKLRPWIDSSMQAAGLDTSTYILA